MAPERALILTPRTAMAFTLLPWKASLLPWKAGEKYKRREGRKGYARHAGFAKQGMAPIGSTKGWSLVRRLTPRPNPLLERRSLEMSRPAFAALQAEAAAIGWPTSFESDLIHDRNLIAALLPREPFAWCLRTDGTHMGLADKYTVTGKRLTMAMVAEAFRGSEFRWFVWDGRALQSVDSPGAADDRLNVLAARRFLVSSRRKSTLVACGMADRASADSLAADWERRYGEDFEVIDTWKDANAITDDDIRALRYFLGEEDPPDAFEVGPLSGAR